MFGLGIASVSFAAPTSNLVDVPVKHWSYDAVKYLGEQGIIDGYGDGTFRGDKNMSRYEMAQIVYKAMLNQQKANIAQKALIDKLAVEYALEINKVNTMDQRLAAIEKKTDNLQFSGQARMRYSVFSETSGNPGVASSVSSTYRLRLDGVARVDDNTTFDFRFVNRAPDKASLSNSTFQTFGGNGQSGSNYNNIDRAAINAKFGKTKVLIGRQAFLVDPLGAWVDSGAYSFDGVKVSGKSGVINLSAAYGCFISGATWADNSINPAMTTAAGNLDVSSLTAETASGKLKYSAGYHELKNFATGKIPFKWTAFDANYRFNKDYILYAGYLTNSGQEIYGGKDKTGYYTSLMIGDTALSKRGAQKLAISYMKHGANMTPAFLSGWGTPLKTQSQDFHNFDVQYYYAFSKNFNAGLQYSPVVASDKYNGANNTLYRVLTNVKF